MIVLITTQEAKEAVEAVERITGVDDVLLSEIFDTDDSVQLYEPCLSPNWDVRKP